MGEVLKVGSWNPNEQRKKGEEETVLYVSGIVSYIICQGKMNLDIWIFLEERCAGKERKRRTKYAMEVKMGSWSADKRRKEMSRKSPRVLMGSFHRSSVGKTRTCSLEGKEEYEKAKIDCLEKHQAALSLILEHCLID